MHFTGTKHLHEIENIMQEIPNFLPKGHGGTVLKKEMEDYIRGQPPPDSYEEMMSALMVGIGYKPLGERVSRYLEESEGKAVSYRNEKHKAVFEEITAKMDKKNYALLSALYLLTADHRLWKIMKHHTQKNEVDFQNVSLKGIHENGYTLYCVAKDLYLGTKHLSVSDLSDTDLIRPQMFAMICNAMAVRRFGLKAIQLAERRENL
jgi:hypothetical protein